MAQDAPARAFTTEDPRPARVWLPGPGEARLHPRGKAALSGVLSLLGEDLRIVVLKNEQKKNPRDPDYLLHRALDDEPKKAAASPADAEPGGDAL